MAAKKRCIEKIDNSKNWYTLKQKAFTDSLSAEAGKRLNRRLSVEDIRADAAEKRSKASFKFDPLEEIHLIWLFEIRFNVWQARNLLGPAEVAIKSLQIAPLLESSRFVGRRMERRM